MIRWLILLVALAFPASGEETLWAGNKLTPGQPFPGKVLAVERSWSGYRLFIESFGGTDKQYCVAKVWLMNGVEYQEIAAGDLPRPSVCVIFLNPPIEVEGFSWSIGVWKIGKIFGEEDILRQALAAKPRSPLFPAK
jgi:hypothetical protein